MTTGEPRLSSCHIARALSVVVMKGPRDNVVPSDLQREGAALGNSHGTGKPRGRAHRSKGRCKREIIAVSRRVRSDVDRRRAFVSN
jgi:hypothetical protein